jgi:hypothetical protein
MPIVAIWNESSLVSCVAFNKIAAGKTTVGTYVDIGPRHETLGEEGLTAFLAVGGRIDAPLPGRKRIRRELGG